MTILWEVLVLFVLGQPAAGLDLAARRQVDGDYAAAAMLYDLLSLGGERQGDFYAAHGSAHFLAGNIPQAIFAYRRALLAGHNDAALRQNLADARSRVAPSSGVPACEGPPHGTSYWLTPVALGLWLAGWIVSLAWLPGRRIRWLLLGSALGAVALLLLIQAHARLDREAFAVVAVDEVVLRRGNGHSYAEVVHDEHPIKLTRGVEAIVRTVRTNGWVQSELGNGVIGWAPRQDLLMIPPRDHPAEQGIPATFQVSYCNPHFIPLHYLPSRDDPPCLGSIHAPLSHRGVSCSVRCCANGTSFRWHPPVRVPANPNGQGCNGNLSALILDWYDELGNGGDPVLFGRKVRARYSEGTLQRLLSHSDGGTREAAVAALRVVGSIASNETLAACLHDELLEVQELAEAGLWAIWFRADSSSNNLELQRLTRLIHDKEYGKALSGLNALIARAPLFAEAYNQRAILYWHWSEYKRSIADCEQVLRLNPLHFGAQAGMAQCYWQLHRPAEALRAFRRAQAIHPGLMGVGDSIRSLERMLKDNRRKEDKK